MYAPNAAQPATCLFAALAVLSLAGAATAAPYNPEGLPADQIAAVQNICRATVGLTPGESHFAGCVSSLSQSWRSLNGHAAADAGARPTSASYFHASPAQTRQREQDACAQLGFDRSSRGFASCVAGLQSAMFAADHPIN